MEAAVSFEELVGEMVEEDLVTAESDQLVKQHGYRALEYHDESTDLARSKIYVAGHQGLVGSALVRRLAREGYENVAARTHAELDL